MSRQEILEQLADQHEAQLKSTLRDLEEEILSSISRATGGSELIDTRIAIELRKDIKRHLQETYLFVSDKLVRDYDKVVNEFIKEFGALKIPDKTIVFPSLDRNFTVYSCCCCCCARPTKFGNHKCPTKIQIGNTESLQHPLYI